MDGNNTSKQFRKQQQNTQIQSVKQSKNIYQKKINIYQKTKEMSNKMMEKAYPMRKHLIIPMLVKRV
jgi:hypothetical protein